jgi:hypothetical protein
LFVFSGLTAGGDEKMDIDRTESWTAHASAFEAHFEDVGSRGLIGMNLLCSSVL